MSILAYFIAGIMFFIMSIGAAWGWEFVFHPAYFTIAIVIAALGFIGQFFGGGSEEDEDEE